MKRIFLLLITAIAFGASAMAQDSRVATLQHGSNFRTYYGTDAFISAHADAADGDVITLTAGEFNCPPITKALTIRGEGMRKTIISFNNNTNITIPKDSPYSLCFEGLKAYAGHGLSIRNNAGSETVVFSRCAIENTYYMFFKNCNAVVLNSYCNFHSTDKGMVIEENSSVTCVNSVLPRLTGCTFDVNNCVITDVANVTNSIIKNSIIYGVSTLDNTNTTSHCLVKYGSSGFDNSWYVKTEPDVNPDPWGEDPETPTLWADLFGENYHLTEAAAATYVGTDGTEVGIYGGAYPYDETPDYPLVKNLEVKGIQEDGKLTVKINVK